MRPRQLESAKEKILKAKSIAVAGHINPDGDSIGSILSLGLGLERLGKRVQMLSFDGVPKRYTGLPGAKRILRNTTVTPDLAIGVDCGSRELLGGILPVFERAKLVLEIDHHEFRKPFGHMSLVDYGAAAVGEMIYILLKEMKVKITRNIAQNIMTSIIVETNSFRLPDVRPMTFEICAELIKSGVDFYRLVDTVFWSRTKGASLLLGTALSRCSFLMDGAIIWSVIRKSDFEKAGGSDEDVDPVVDEMRSVKGVKAAVLFREKENGTLRVSLRSKGKVNIASLAERYSGGGHFDSAGCHIPNRPGSIEGFLNSAQELLR